MSTQIICLKYTTHLWNSYVSYWFALADLSTILLHLFFKLQLYFKCTYTAKAVVQIYHFEFLLVSLIYRYHRWAQVTRFLVIADKELNRTHRVYSIKRESRFIKRIVHSTEHGSRPTLSRDWPQGLEGFCAYWVDPSWLVLVGFSCACTSSCITLKLLHMWSSMIFLDWPLEKGVTQC